jgi:predicted RNA methylase
MKIAPDLLPILSTLAYPTPQQARIVDQLDRAEYTKINKVLEALGGTWNRKAKAHVFDGDAAERIAYALVVGEVETAQDVGHFVTPAPLARQLVELAGVRHGMQALEPSAGEGAIVLALQDAGACVTAVERDHHRRMRLTERVLKGRDRLVEGDFMHCSAGRFDLFDCTVMNPPFCRVGAGDHLDHVRKAIGLTKQGGIVVAVLPLSITFRRDRRHTEFRGYIEAMGTIAPLPARSFHASGTDVNTVVIRVVVP